MPVPNLAPRWRHSLVASSLFAVAAASLANPLPKDEIAYASSIPTVRQVLGVEPGDRHFSHDELLRYYEAVAAASDRVQLLDIGRTHELRRQLLAFVSSPGNLAQLEALRLAHTAYADGDADVPGPLVTWLGYSVHGNETSGAHASAYTVYHLAAAPSEALNVDLENTVVIIEPSINPDGMQRFTSWVNSHRSEVLVTNSSHREHREVWPGGRTNHYWFDLNRDWLLLQHPESRARIEQFQRWLPNVLGDYHEMGTAATYFFQPGIPSRNNPRTPPRTFELTAGLAAFHARALDAFAQPYYTEESFDDFYYGKGSTYPDLQGGVGVLFEQASPRGRAQASPNGQVTLEQAVRNQFATSLSLLAGSEALREELLAHQRAVRRDALAAGTEARGGWVFATPSDPQRGQALALLLAGHDIEVYAQQHAPEHAFLVPAAQVRYPLVQTLFESVTEFADPTFYDVSAWNANFAYDVDVERVSRLPAPAQRITRQTRFAPGRLRGATEADTVAYVLDWQRGESARSAIHWLRKGLRLRVVTRPFTALVEGANVTFARGAVIALVGTQKKSASDVRELVQEVVAEEGATVYALASALTPAGPDLGGRSTAPLRTPKVLLVGGQGTSSYEVGELWHLTDHRLGLATTIVDLADLRTLSLRSYTHVLMVDGDYDDLDPKIDTRLREYACGGGTVLAQRRAARWWADTGLTRVRASVPRGPQMAAPYETRDETLQRERIAGAILSATIDLTHPLGFGLPDERLPVFRQGELRLDRVLDPFANVASYPASGVVLSGYVSAANQASLAGQAAVIVEPVGRGRAIFFADTPNFRAYFHGTERVYRNALLFSSAIQFDRDVLKDARERCDAVVPQ